MDNEAARVEEYYFDPSVFVAECLPLVTQGIACSEIIVYLQQKGLSLIDSVEVVSDLYRISLTGAKKIVFSHPTWRVVAEASSELHESLIQELKEDGKLVKQKDGSCTWTDRLR